MIVPKNLTLNKLQRLKVIMMKQWDKKNKINEK